MVEAWSKESSGLFLAATS